MVKLCDFLKNGRSTFLPRVFSWPESNSTLKGSLEIHTFTDYLMRYSISVRVSPKIHDTASRSGLNGRVFARNKISSHLKCMCITSTKIEAVELRDPSARAAPPLNAAIPFSSSLGLPVDIWKLPSAEPTHTPRLCLGNTQF